MRVVKGLLLAFLATFSFSGTLSAQDIHYTMFDMAPIRMNPAQTGFFEGTFRIGGIYRTQWQALSPNGSLGGKFGGYQTPHAFIDLPFAFPKKKSVDIKNWAGVGLTFLSDKVSELKNINAMLSLAYHLGFGQGNTRLSFGVRGGIVQQSVDYSTFKFEEGIVLGGGITDGIYNNGTADNTVGNQQVSYPDFSAGLLFAHRSRAFGMEAGFSVNHFTMPKYGFNGSEERLPLGFMGSLIMDVQLSNRLMLRPLVFYHNVKAAMDLNMQLLLGIHFNDAKDITFYVGGGYRIGDAGIARIGLDLKGLRFGFAYDLNFNSLSIKQNARPMGFEVGLSYIAKIYKNPIIKEILFCPRF